MLNEYFLDICDIFLSRNQLWLQQTFILTPFLEDGLRLPFFVLEPIGFLHLQFSYLDFEPRIASVLSEKNCSNLDESTHIASKFVSEGNCTNSSFPQAGTDTQVLSNLVWFLSQLVGTQIGSNSFVELGTWYCSFSLHEVSSSKQVSVDSLLLRLCWCFFFPKNDKIWCTIIWQVRVFTVQL